jgi:hypothetical protein
LTFRPLRDTTGTQTPKNAELDPQTLHLGGVASPASAGHYRKPNPKNKKIDPQTLHCGRGFASLASAPPSAGHYRKQKPPNMKSLTLKLFIWGGFASPASAGHRRMPKPPKMKSSTLKLFILGGFASPASALSLTDDKQFLHFCPVRARVTDRAFPNAILALRERGCGWIETNRQPVSKVRAIPMSKL